MNKCCDLQNMFFLTGDNSICNSNNKNLGGIYEQNDMD